MFSICLPKGERIVVHVGIHSPSDCGDHDNRDDGDGSSQAGICCVEVHG